MNLNGIGVINIDYKIDQNVHSHQGEKISGYDFANEGFYFPFESHASMVLHIVVIKTANSRDMYTLYLMKTRCKVEQINFVFHIRCSTAHLFNFMHMYRLQSPTNCN